MQLDRRDGMGAGAPTDTVDSHLGYRCLEGGDLWRGPRARRCVVFQMLTRLLPFRVVHNHHFTLNDGRHQHRQHLRGHPCNIKAEEKSRGRGGGHSGAPPGGVSVPRLTVGCGRVSVPVIPPEEHVEGQIRNVVALSTENGGADERRETVSMVTQRGARWQNSTRRSSRNRVKRLSLIYAHEGLKEAGGHEEPQHAARRRPRGYEPHQQIGEDGKRSGQNQPARQTSAERGGDGDGGGGSLLLKVEHHAATGRPTRG